MCRAQPGPRCPKHMRAKTTSLLAARKRADNTLATTNPGTRAYERAVHAREHLDDELVLTYNDLNSSASRRGELEDEIDARAAADPNDPQLRILSRSLATGRLLHAERTRQQKMMPPVDLDSCTPEAKQAWLDLGAARADMARYKVRMDVNGSQPDVWASWRSRHADAAHDAEIAAARFAAIQKDGPHAWGSMTSAQRTEARAAVNDTADFTTPSAPQPLEDVFNDYIDQQAGQPPTVDPELVNWTGQSGPDPDIDSPSWAEARAKQNAADADADEPTAYSAKQRTPPGYVGRRAARKRRAGSARGALRELRRKNSQVADGQQFQSLTRPSPGQGGDPDKAAISDPTGMMMLMALFSGRR